MEMEPKLRDRLFAFTPEKEELEKLATIDR